MEGFETVKGPGHIYVLERFLWLDVEARPEKHKNESKNKTKNKIKQNTKTGQEAIEKFQVIKMEYLTREAEQQKKRWNKKPQTIKSGGLDDWYINWTGGRKNMNFHLFG